MTGMKNQTCKRNSASDVALICFFPCNTRWIMFSPSSRTTLPTVPGYAGMFQMWSVVDDSPGEVTSWHCAGEIPRRVVHCVLLGMSVRPIYIQCWSLAGEDTQRYTCDDSERHAKGKDSSDERNAEEVFARLRYAYLLALWSCSPSGARGRV